MSTYFVSLFMLDSRDHEYHFRDVKGRSPRAIVEQVDGDRFHFTSLEGARTFARIHGMQAVADVDMKRLRAGEQP